MTIITAVPGTTVTVPETHPAQSPGAVHTTSGVHA